MFFVIPSNIAKKEAEEDLFLHDKNATFHSASFHENFILFLMIIQQNIFCVHSSAPSEKLNPNRGTHISFYEGVHQNKQSKQS